MPRWIPWQHWQTAADQHRQRMRRWTQPYRERRRLGQSHPIDDFLFIYYRYSPGKLEQWHPGAHAVLERAGLGSDPPPAGYRRQAEHLVCDPHLMGHKVRRRLQWTLDLLRATAQRPPNLGCYGLHEWAMVYQAQDIRHAATTPLRLAQAEVDAVVESRRLTCSHFDAFRFFASAARPLNRLQPNLEDRPQQEQPGCIHANMDLYKWAYKSQPWVGSDLVGDCFELAQAARLVDMRASPYDLSGFCELPPILIETAAGRADYVTAQLEIYQRSRPLRQQLMDQLEQALRLTTDDAGPSPDSR